MFENRLRILLSVLAIACFAVFLRLAQLQLVRADYYAQRANQSLIARPEPLPFLRGQILDRNGEVLVADVPTWDICVDYPIIAASVDQDADVWSGLLRKYRRRYAKNSDGTPATVEQRRARLREDMESSWLALAQFAERLGQPVSLEDIRTRGLDIHQQVQRIRIAVSRRRGFDSPVAEETTAQAIIPDIGADHQALWEQQLAAWPWVHIQASTNRRCIGDATSFAHVLGRMGRVSAETVATDPQADNPFAKYLANEKHGISGVEYAAEDLLRGRRGQYTVGRDVVLSEEIPAAHGLDVKLTIDAPLQRQLYDLLGEVVEAVPDSSGGAIVVLDVASRDVLSLVSYPSYDPNRFNELYDELRDDTDRLPLWFRASASRYAPGSTIKPLACLAGLVSGKITLDTRENCTGYMFSEKRDGWRCWEIHGTGMRKAHGSIDVTEALTGSCNIFMYRLGERVGVDGLCSAFDMVGVGRGSGIGLREDNPGINPTPAWLSSHLNRTTTTAHSRLFAMGQGEISLTPIQVANLMATYASGRYKPATLIRRREDKPEWRLPGSDAQWLAIRRGIFGVTNDPDGTAYKFANFVRDGYALAGKTGTATATRWPTAYRIPYMEADGSHREVVLAAGARGPALKRFEREFPDAMYDKENVTAARYWPVEKLPEGQRYSHAWFGGYLQPLGKDAKPDWRQQPPVAFAILVEFGGSGGRTSGPLAKQVCDAILERFGSDIATTLREKIVSDDANKDVEIN